MNDHTAPLRVEPVQFRARTRLDQLKDAARQAIATHGRDGFTTKHVAELAGASIGTVYRYFADRNAILDALYPNRIEGLGAVAEPTADRIWIVNSDDGVLAVFTTEELADAHAAGYTTTHTWVEWTWLIGEPDRIREALTTAAPAPAELTAVAS